MIIRPAKVSDATDMTTVLNAIIVTGGTTAHQRPFDTDSMTQHYIASAENISCQVAEDTGRIIGFQWLGWPTGESMPEGWAIIASFVAQEAAGKGVGQKLFSATKAAANQARVQMIDATIRADNVSGLRYYGGLGFVDYDRLTNIPLHDGTCVDRIRKRYDLAAN